MHDGFRVKYWDSAVTGQRVTFWQGLRDDPAHPGQYVISGTALTSGLVYVGPLTGGGQNYLVNYPGATSTSVYGPDNLDDGRLRLVGSITMPGDSRGADHGFLWEGTLADLPDGGSYRMIDYPGATYQFTHSTMGGLAVGNADGPTPAGLPLGPGIAYLYDVESGTFPANIVYPGSRSNTAYGIWHNGGTSYTICGGYSPVEANNFASPRQPLPKARGFLVDYDSSTKTFSNWTSFDYPHGPEGADIITHFEGISSPEPGVYTLSADSVQTGSTRLLQGSWVRVIRQADGTFDKGTWVDLNYPEAPRTLTSSNSVYGNAVVGIVFDATITSFQAEIVPG